MMQDKCVCCGAVVPEGRQVCAVCEHLGRTRLTVRHPASEIYPEEDEVDGKEENRP